MNCLFCRKFEEHDAIVYENDSVFVIYDSFPVTKGHCLIIPKRHVKDYFEITETELMAIDKAINAMKAMIDTEYKPDGYNIGINNGSAAGQTIMHLHIHLIPRYAGDCQDPRGGIRGVIPAKQKY